MVLEAIKFIPCSDVSPASLHILDQLLLPHQTSWLAITGSDSAFEAIRSMRVRGAPAIALVAALSLVVESPSKFKNSNQWNIQSAVEWHCSRLDHLVMSRPTAVNLGDAAEKLKNIVTQAACTRGSTVERVLEAYVEAAEGMLQSDVRDNVAIGSAGAQWIRENLLPADEKCSILTHCNTGSLATAGYGTALGVIRSLNSAGLLRRVYYTETRPYNQGSRLTGFELLHDSIPAMLITDSMAGALFQTKGKADNIVAVIVGADRVAANGDTANKIGTYGLAVLARQHGIKFLVAAPRTTIDLKTASGDEIVIEERPEEEIISIKGPRIKNSVDGVQVIDENVDVISTAPLGTRAWNPAFDVTPASLIDGIVTEAGVAEKTKGTFNLASFFSH